MSLFLYLGYYILYPQLPLSPSLKISVPSSLLKYIYNLPLDLHIHRLFFIFNSFPLSNIKFRSNFVSKFLRSFFLHFRNTHQSGGCKIYLPYTFISIFKIWDSPTVSINIVVRLPKVLYVYKIY